jgi:hypothetical protein
MADRPYSTPVPHPAEVRKEMVKAAVQWENIALKWRDLAERRHAQYLDLYKSGRWKIYYTEERFRAEMRDAIELAQRWAAIAPRREERDPPAVVAGRSEAA